MTGFNSSRKSFVFFAFSTFSFFSNSTFASPPIQQGESINTFILLHFDTDILLDVITQSLNKKLEKFCENFNMSDSSKFDLTNISYRGVYKWVTPSRKGNMKVIQLDQPFDPEVAVNEITRILMNLESIHLDNSLQTSAVDQNPTGVDITKLLEKVEDIEIFSGRSNLDSQLTSVLEYANVDLTANQPFFVTKKEDSACYWDSLTRQLHMDFIVTSGERDNSTFETLLAGAAAGAILAGLVFILIIFVTFQKCRNYRRTPTGEAPIDSFPLQVIL